MEQLKRSLRFLLNHCPQCIKHAVATPLTMRSLIKKTISLQTSFWALVQRDSTYKLEEVLRITVCKICLSNAHTHTHSYESHTPNRYTHLVHCCHIQVIFSYFIVNMELWYSSFKSQFYRPLCTGCKVFVWFLLTVFILFTSSYMWLLFHSAYLHTNEGFIRTLKWNEMSEL